MEDEGEKQKQEEQEQEEEVTRRERRLLPRLATQLGRNRDSIENLVMGWKKSREAAQASPLAAPQALPARGRDTVLRLCRRLS